MNLRCPSLTHFRWYKDVFLSRIFLRPDSNHVLWKERFIAGLPSLFAKKVKSRLTQLQGTYDLTPLTYGEIINEVTKEGLSLCNDMRLRNQLKKQNLLGKKELGEFCYQFGYDPLVKTKLNKTYKNKNNCFYKKKSTKHLHKSYPRPFSSKYCKTSKLLPQWGNTQPRTIKSRKNRFIQSKRQPHTTSQEPTCWKCGQVGHYQNHCRASQRINQLKISDSEKSDLLKILSENYDHISDDDIHLDNSSSS